MQSLPFSGSFPAQSSAPAFDFLSGSSPGRSADSTDHAASATADRFAAFLTAQQPATLSAEAAEAHAVSADADAPESEEPDRTATESLLALMQPFVPPPPTPVATPRLNAATSVCTQEPGDSAEPPSGLTEPPAAAPLIDAALTLETSAAPAPASPPETPPGSLEAVPTDFVATENQKDSAPTASAPDAVSPDASDASTTELARPAASPTGAYEAVASTMAPSPSPTPSAKFSRAGDPGLPRSGSDRMSDEINFLNNENQQPATAEALVGTAIANEAVESMLSRSATSTSQPGPDVSVKSLAATAASWFDASASTAATAGSPELEATTPRSLVQQVIATAEAAQASSETATKNVKLNFDFGDAQVQVRIEIRTNLVRAHFQTDSAELRNSLSHEWQAAAAAEPARFARVAEPVFTSDQSFSNQESGSRDHGQRESAREQSPAESAPLFARFLNRAASAGVSSAVPAPSLPPLATLTQLNAFA